MARETVPGSSVGGGSDAPGAPFGGALRGALAAHQPCQRDQPALAGTGARAACNAQAAEASLSVCSAARGENVFVRQRGSGGVY